MAKPFQLGRGLASLIPQRKAEPVMPAAVPPAAPAPVVGAAVQSVDPRLISPSRQQPRTNFDDAMLAELVASVKTHGILQPLVVAPEPGGRYRLIVGERRLRAAIAAGLKEVPVIVREASEQQRLELAVVENVQRQSLNPIEEAAAYQRLQDEFGLTQEEVAKRVAKSRSQVANTERLLQLPGVVRQALVDGRLTVGHAKVILSLDDPVAQEKFFREVTAEGLPVHLSEAKARGIRVKSHVRKVRTPDPELSEVERQLQAALGTRVKVKGARGRGVIEIVFFSLEELVELVRKVTGRS